MRSPTNNTQKSLSALTAIAAAAVVAVGWVSLRGRDEPAIVVTPSTPSAAPPVRVASTDPPTEPPAIVKLRELRAMSETYRNTTFLIAIRDAGFLCRELLGAHGGVDPSTTWTASCSDMLAYTVRVAASGSLAVEPFGQYWDGLTLQIDQRTQPSPAPPPRLPPEPLR